MTRQEWKGPPAGASCGHLRALSPGGRAGSLTGTALSQGPARAPPQPCRQGRLCPSNGRNFFANSSPNIVVGSLTRGNRKCPTGHDQRHLGSNIRGWAPGIIPNSHTMASLSPHRCPHLCPHGTLPCLPFSVLFRFPKSTGPPRQLRGVISLRHVGSLSGPLLGLPTASVPGLPWVLCLSVFPSRCDHCEVRPAGPGPTATSVFITLNPPALPPGPVSGPQ